MKNLTFATTLLASLSMLAACTQEKLSEWTDDGTVALKVSSDILTKAYDNVWENGDKIGISGTSGSKTYTNVSYTTPDGNGNFTVSTEGEEIYFQNNDEVTFTAYYPHNDNSYPTITADTWVQSEQKTFDFLWAQETGSKENPEVNFVFDHVMAKLVITVKAGKDVTFDEIDKARLTLGGFYHVGTFNAESGKTEISTASPAADYMFAGNVTAAFNAPSVPNQTDASKTFTLILFPQAFNDPISFKAEFTTPDTQEFIIEGGLDFTNANANAGDYPAINAWVAGRQYNVTVTLNKTAIEANGTIKNWTTTGEIEADAR